LRQSWSLPGHDRVGKGINGRATMRIKEYATGRPLGTYFGLAFFISWAGSLLAGGSLFLRGQSAGPQDLWAMGFAMLAGPLVAGLAMTYLVDGRKGLQGLFNRMRTWRVGGRWYAALLIFPALILAVLLGLSAWVSPQFRPTFFGIGILMGLFAGFVEETGWMGFAFPRMRSRWSVLRGTLFLGTLHALWHIAADLMGSYHARGEQWLPYFAGFFLFVIALRFIIVWIYVNTKSLLLAQFAHASSTGFLGILVPMDLSPANTAIFYLVYAGVLSAAAAVIVVGYGPSLTRRAAERRAAQMRGH
jgi:membrane protease YdiL (CAAX protease family)